MAAVIGGAYHWATDQLPYLITSERHSAAFIAFLEQLVRQHNTGRPLVIVLDNGSIHRSQATQAAFALLEHQLLPLFLPKYCSELNPIERFGKHLKASACSNKVFPNMEALLVSVEQLLQQQNDCQSAFRFMFLKNFPLPT